MIGLFQGQFFSPLPLPFARPHPHRERSLPNPARRSDHRPQSLQVRSLSYCAPDIGPSHRAFPPAGTPSATVRHSASPLCLVSLQRHPSPPSDLHRPAHRHRLLLRHRRRQQHRGSRPLRLGGLPDPLRERRVCKVRQQRVSPRPPRRVASRQSSYNLCAGSSSRPRATAATSAPASSPTLTSRMLSSTRASCTAKKSSSAPS